MKKIRYLLVIFAISFLSIYCGSPHADEPENPSVETETVAGGILVNSIVMKPGNFEHFIEISGIVEADRNVVVSAEVPGTVAKIVVKEGQNVSKGQALAYLNAAVIESGIEEIRSQLKLATIVFEKREKLWEQKIGSELEYLQSKTNKESLEKKLITMESQKDQSVITSPINGTVEEIYTKQGELISPGVPFASVVNLSTVTVRAEVSEAYLKYVRKGDSIKVTFPAIDVSYGRRISRVGNVINPNNRTFPIEVELDNRDSYIKLNAICMVKFRDYVNRSALSVPSEIVRQDAKGYYVFRIDENGEGMLARKVYIEIGKTGVGITEVLSGLSEDEQIITDGYNEVREGVKVVINN